MYYLKALLFTELIECAVSYILSRDKEWTGYIFLLNLLTNPLANLIYRGLYPLVSKTEAYVLLSLIEIGVLFIEGVIIYRLRRSGNFGLRQFTVPKAFLYSLILNASSFAAGLLLPFIR